MAPRVGSDDAGLIRRCLARDERACEALVSAHARMVGSIIWRACGDAAVVEDLAQETFLRVFRALPYFDGRARLSTWICTVAHRIVIDHLRKQGRTIEDADSVDVSGADILERLPADTTFDPERRLASQELTDIVRVELGRLPDKYRLPLVYVAIEDMDYATVAAMLGAPVGTVKSLVFRAKQMLRARVIAALRSPARKVGASDAV